MKTDNTITLADIIAGSNGNIKPYNPDIVRELTLDSYRDMLNDSFYQLNLAIELAAKDGLMRTDTSLTFALNSNLEDIYNFLMEKIAMNYRELGYDINFEGVTDLDSETITYNFDIDWVNIVIGVK